VLGGVDSVANSIIVNEQSKSNPDFSFYSPIESIASGRSYQNLFISYKLYSAPYSAMFSRHPLDKSRRHAIKQLRQRNQTNYLI